MVECTPNNCRDRRGPALADVFQTLSRRHAGAARTILQLFAFDQPLVKRQALSAEVLDTVDRLHRRYATYSAFPGRPLRFVQNLLNDHAGEFAVTLSDYRTKKPGEPKDKKARKKRSAEARERKTPVRVPPKPITTSDVLSTFTRETGLPRFLLDPAEPLDLDAAHAWFSARVIGQPEAVDLVAALIGTVKAGLTPPLKPIASLLFVGPTGVGKTEMAKALAEFLFGSLQQLTQFDMSEFGGGRSTAAGRHRVRQRGACSRPRSEQPASVVLLDEFEKAHSSNRPDAANAGEAD